MISLLRSFLAAALLLPALTIALARPASGAEEKVVFTSNARLSEADVRLLRDAAPSLEIVFPSRENLARELTDAGGVIGGMNREQFLAAKKLRWWQVTSAGVENYLANIPELRDSAVTLTNMKIVQGPEIADHAFALLLRTKRVMSYL
ncbi:MAG: hypothetical protein ACREIA_16140 [Opitutaceae bacterium]